MRQVKITASVELEEEIAKELEIPDPTDEELEKSFASWVRKQPSVSKEGNENE